MKIVRTEYLVCAGDFPDSPEWESLDCDIGCGIESIGSPELAGRREHDVPMAWRRSFISYLESFGWQPALHLDNTPLKTCTPFDAGMILENKYVVAEFAPTNVQSANTTLSKMALGIVRGVIAAGVLIVVNEPRRLKPRVRSAAFTELVNYFDLWRALNVEEGLLLVMAVE